jgi:hypothetical protein
LNDGYTVAQNLVHVPPQATKAAAPLAFAAGAYGCDGSGKMVSTRRKVTRAFGQESRDTHFTFTHFKKEGET